jgi:hypothetical protein
LSAPRKIRTTWLSAGSKYVNGLPTAPGAPAQVVRGAFLGLGDVKLAQGDVAGALESYQQALAGGTPGDTLTQRVQDKINALGKADAPSPNPPKQP